MPVWDDGRVEDGIERVELLSASMILQ